MTMTLKQKKSALVASCCAVLAFGTAFTLAFGFGLAAAMVVGGLDPPWHIGNGTPQQQNVWSIHDINKKHIIYIYI